jgi:RNA polymerase primary sigma factor
MDESRREVVEGVIRTLQADHARMQSALPQSRIELLIERRGLNPAEAIEVHRTLASLGLPMEEEREDLPDTYPLQRGNRELFARMMAHRLLLRDEETRLLRSYQQSERLRCAILQGEVEADATTEDILRRGDKALGTLVECNARLLYHVARRHMRQSGMSVEDLVQEGVPGLIRALQLFDFSHDVKLATYATWWIRQSISRAIMDRGALIRLPVHVAVDVMKLRRAEDRLMAQTGRAATSDELAIELEWPKRRLGRVRKASRVALVSLDAPNDGENGTASLVSSIPSSDPLPDQVVIDQALASNVRMSLAKLSSRTSNIINRRFGVDNGNAETLEAIGQTYRLTRERIRQLEAIGLRKLKHPSLSRRLRTFLDH